MSSQLSHRHLALIDQDTPPAVVLAHFRDVAGLRIGSSIDALDPTTAYSTFLGGGPEVDGYLLPTLGVAIFTASAGQLTALREHRSPLGETNGLLALEPERALWPAHARQPTEPSDTPPHSGSGDSGPPGRPDSPFPSPAQARSLPSWLHPRMTPGIDLPHLTGVGVRVAILDTGIDPSHEQFADRPLYAISVVPDTEPRDVHGHGTRIAELITSLAPDVELYCAKVFPDKPNPDSPDALDGYVLTALEWCVQHAVDVVVLPAAALAGLGGHSDVFEYAARRALDHDVLLIAAAGNHSDRDTSVISPVAHPANCPSVLAVAALEPTPPGTPATWRVAPYSNAGISGQIDIAAPVWDIDSFHGMKGTSIAAGYTAAVAALISADTLARGRALWAQLAINARRLHLPSTDVGAGMAFTDVMDPALQPRP